MNIVYDIGANLGNFTQKFLDEGYKVVSVEPNPDIFKKLQDRFKGNENVTLINRAVSSDAGEIEFYIPNNDRKHEVATCNKEWFEGRFKSVFDSGYITIKVGSITIDELIEEHGEPTRIKIDVEGHEVSAIRSMTKKHECVISFEWTTEYFENCLTVLKHLKELGFSEYNIMYSDKGQLKENEWVSIETQCNQQKTTDWGDMFVR